MKVKKTIARQLSLASAGPRFARMAAVIAAWVGANGLPEWGNYEGWVLFVSSVLAVSFTGEGDPND